MKEEKMDVAKEKETKKKSRKPRGYFGLDDVDLDSSMSSTMTTLTGKSTPLVELQTRQSSARETDTLLQMTGT